MNIDGRPLLFVNDNRPAHRYLYLRNIMSVMRAERAGWNYSPKPAPLKIWTSLDNPDAYSRRSTPRALVKQFSCNDIPGKLITEHLWMETAQML
jgi:hypothetical protein